MRERRDINDTDYECSKHPNDHSWPCNTCTKERAAREAQAAHEESIKRQKNRIKVFDRSNVLER